MFYCNSRYYDHEIGRWISPDSIDYLDLESINGLNLYTYCGNNPIMYTDSDGHMPKWAQWLIRGGLIVGAIVLTIAATAGLGVSIAGATVGTATGALISAGTQIFTNRFDNFSWREVGLGVLKGGIAGGIAGGLFGAIQYGLSASKIANGVSRLNSAQTRLDNALNPLSNVKNFAKMPFSGANIARTVGQTVSNYNSAYSAFVLAKGTYSFVKVGINIIYFGLENLTSEFIGMGLGLLF